MPRPTLTVRRIALPLLAALLLLVQALGLVHRVMHAPHGLLLGAQAVASHADELFGAHDDEATCRMYDQLAHADIVFGAWPAWALAAQHECVAVPVHAGRLAPQASGYLARGPPRAA